MKVNLFQHQKEGLKKVLENEAFPLFMEQGTGKTAIAIKAIEERFLDKQIERVVLFVPNSIIYNWTLEFEKFLELSSDQYTIETLSKKESRPKRLERFHKFLGLDLNNHTLKELKELGYKGKKSEIVKNQKPHLFILLLNFEKALGFKSEIKKFKPQMLIVDESHKVKNRNSKTSKAIYTLTRQTPFRILMTGTPIMNGIEDLFMQYKILDEEILGRNYNDFERLYIEKGGFMGKEIIGYKNENLFKKLVADNSYRVRIDEVIELPPLRTRYLTTTLNPQSQKVYNELKKEMVTRVEKVKEEISRKDIKRICKNNLIPYNPKEPYTTLLFKAIDLIESTSCDLVITQLIRLQQITGGFITRDEGDMVKIGEEKINLVKEVVNESTKPMLIFCRYVAEVIELKEQLSKIKRGGKKLRVDIYRDKDKREQVYDRFQKGEIDILILQFQSGSVGLNLQIANKLIFYSWSFSSGDYQQAIARIKRSGQKNPMEITHLVVEDTIDQDILQTLKVKQRIAKKVLD